MLRVVVLKEKRPDEHRVAATPDTVKKMVEMGLEVVLEKEAGIRACFLDESYKAAGATIAKDALGALKSEGLVLKVQAPLLPHEKGEEELSQLPEACHLIGLLNPLANPSDVALYAQHKINSFSLDLLPRITRAQSMDALSSQANLAGYRAVIEAAAEYGHALPMMMTAAGTIPPARVLILGAGVAGLQAIATARRLGAIVSAFDVRKVAKEQVESLGASFIEVDGEDAESKEGYAQETSRDYQKRQADKIHESLKKSNIVISTALIPGKPAPILITEPMVKDMKPGSIIVDLASGAGGNCTLTEPGQVIVKHHVKICGYTNFPSRIAADASALYGRNLLSFLTHLIDQKSHKLHIRFDDEIIKATLLTYHGKVVHDVFKT